MPWAPGQSGNPHGWQGPREKYRKEVHEKIKGLGHLDAMEILSTIANDQAAELGYRVAAASALMPYGHPKLQSVPTPRFIDLQLDVPEFTHVSDAEAFLARIALLCAKGHLDIQSAQELSGLVKLWIDSQYQREELQFKINPPEERDVQIRVVGGLPELPGTNITMPQLNGHVADARALAAPVDTVPDGPNGPPDGPNGPSDPCELKAQGEHPLQEHHFKPDPEQNPDDP
jgi:hypothetical protein